MWSTIISFEKAAGEFSPQVLIGAGCGLLVVGIIIWLCGVRYSRAVTSLIGAAAAAAAAYRLAGANPSTTAIAAATGLVLGALFKQSTNTLAVGAIVFTAVFLVMGEPVEPATDVVIVHQEQPASAEAEPKSAAEAALIAHAHIEQAGQLWWQTLRQQELPVVATAALIALAAVAMATLFPNLGASLICASIGAIASLLGLAMLAQFKGNAPYSWASQYGVKSWMAMGALVLFGVAIQMIFARPRKKQATAPAAPEQPAPTRKMSWRNT